MPRASTTTPTATAAARCGTWQVIQAANGAAAFTVPMGYRDGTLRATRVDVTMVPHPPTAHSVKEAGDKAKPG